MGEITLGFDALINAMGRAEEIFLPIASKAIAVSLEAIYEAISPYPPQPDRMRSGRLNTYVRGQGQYPTASFRPDASEPGGFKSIRTKKTAIRMTSQQMDKKYKMSVGVKGNSILGELRNDAGYSGYVVGPKQGDPHQVAFHAETGWVSEDEAILQATPQIEQSVETAVDLFMAKLAGVE